MAYVEFPMLETQRLCRLAEFRVLTRRLEASVERPTESRCPIIGGVESLDKGASRHKYLVGCLSVCQRQERPTA